MLFRIVSDGTVSPQERDELSRFHNTSLLTPEESLQLRDRAFNHVLAKYIGDRRLNPQEQSSLQHLAVELGISINARQESQQLISYHSTLHGLETAALEDLPTLNGQSGVILQRGEQDYFAHSANLLEMRVVRSRVVGRSSGVSFRLMKGVTYRVGQSRGSISSESDWTPVSNGTFVITNQRLVFRGDTKSINTPHSKLLDIETYADAIRFSVTNRQKPVTIRFFSPQSSELAALIISRMLNQ